MSRKNYYDILGVKPTANQQAIKEAYRKLSKKIHPDVNSNDKYFEDYFKSIQEAYEILSNENARRNYDQHFAAYSNTSEIEIKNLKQQLLALESRNRDLGAKLREITTERDSIKHELENYKHSYFEAKAKESALSNRILELENRTPSQYVPSAKDPEQETNWKAWILGGILAYLWLMGFIDFNKQDLQKQLGEANGERERLRGVVANQQKSKDSINAALATAKQELSTAKSKLNRISDGTPFLVESITFYTSSNSSKFKTRFYRGEIDYIYPHVKIVPLTDSYKSLKVFVKIFDPDGTLNHNSQHSPKGYTFSNDVTVSYLDSQLDLSGWGNNTRDAFEVGTHRVQIWANGKLMGETKFEVY